MTRSTDHRTIARARGVLFDVDWKTRAECRKHPADWWFPDGEQDCTAISICRECPVRRECGRHAYRTSERRGIAAGFRLASERERDSLRRWLDIAPSPADHVCGKCGLLIRNRMLLCRGCRYDAPAQPVLDHVAALRAVQTLPQIAANAGMSLSLLKKLIYGNPPPQFISPKHADRILAVKAPRQARP